MTTMHEKLVKVSGKSRASKVAGAIAGIMRESDHVVVQAIGATAVNQAIKSIALARGYLEDDDINIVCTPEFADVEIEGKKKTAIKLLIKRGVRDG